MLPDDIYEKVTTLSEAANQEFERAEFTKALSLYDQAWDLLPPPKNPWEACLWLTAAQADCLYFLARFPEARERLQDALKLPGGIANTFVHLRLGEVEFELGNLDSAADHLMRAHAVGGPELLAAEPPRYLQFLSTRAIIGDS